MNDSCRYLFGPVVSRRLGRSLGVDLIPAKTCSISCIFCQLGPTRNPTLERREYVPTEQVIAELRAWIRAGGETDFITLAGSGEPTLHLHFDRVLKFLEPHPFRTALLSNGTLFTDPAVRRGAAHADVVKLSLSAWDRTSFERIHHPHPDLDFEPMMKGYRDFRSLYRGALWLEVFVVPGLNSGEEQVKRIAARAKEIRPDRVQLNTAVRPAAEAGVRAASPDKLQRLAALFDPPAEIAAPRAHGGTVSLPLSAQTLTGILQRHPATAAQLAEMIGHPEEAVRELLEDMVRAGRCHTREQKDETFFTR
ncbi:radical SAM protein [Kiritimatiella glycovorans]|uniref:Putative molybdenum cofactor biosynthesis protein A n=1 Tax=Kiritimatiella glycovorans TaxID=1307763 RepID=A0A0G3EF66_9BACT|nr:radical SAM protein [Kiritimatiella glycovorans]AKJ65101.1 putative molybdenum cofactor biosynthesis protein A [Kiritimatiella glycovorans]